MKTIVDLFEVFGYIVTFVILLEIIYLLHKRHTQKVVEITGEADQEKYKQIMSIYVS